MPVPCQNSIMLKYQLVITMIFFIEVNKEFYDNQGIFKEIIKMKKFLNFNIYLFHDFLIKIVMSISYWYYLMMSSNLALVHYWEGRYDLMYVSI